MSAKVNLQKIFLTPPEGMSERIILFLMLVVTFMVFFGPIKFSHISPIEAIAMAMFPALTTSWGWIVLLRFLFRKSEYLIKK